MYLYTCIYTQYSLIPLKNIMQNMKKSFSHFLRFKENYLRAFRSINVVE